METTCLSILQIHVCQMNKTYLSQHSSNNKKEIEKKLSHIVYTPNLNFLCVDHTLTLIFTI